MYAHHLTGQYIKKPDVGTTYSNFICADEEDVRLMFQRVIFPELEFRFFYTEREGVAAAFFQTLEGM